MANSVTIARPYAKAIFEHALSKGKLQKWSGYLACLALSVLDSNGREFLTNPATTVAQHTELLLSQVSGVDADDLEHLNHFVDALTCHHRVLVLPDIVILFDAMRADYEKTLSVNVCSYSELTDSQQQQLITSLSKRLQRQVTLDVTIDKQLIGGAVIHAGDLVIDGSVRGKLEKLRTGLTA